MGREEEIATFEAALHRGGSVLFVHGPGGVGKSALLRRFAQVAAAAGRRVTTLDGRTLGPTPSMFEAQAEAALRDDGVLLIDTFERLQGLEGWLRERFLPRLPVGALIVVAGRTPPDMLWQADPGWADTLRVMPLRDLGPSDAAALLGARGVAAELLDPLLAFAGGHPLALSLGAAVAVKDQQASARWTPSQDVVGTLLDQLVGEVPSPAHRRTLDVVGLAYLTTEDLLRAVLPEDAEAMFAWLRRLPFIESSRLGLVPHDVVREALEADLRWRDPQRSIDLHHSIHAYLAGQIRAAPDSHVLPTVGSLFFLHRDEEPAPDFHDAFRTGGVHEDVLRPEDTGALVRLAAETDGEEAAAAVALWIDRQPQAFRLYRLTESGELVAFCAWLRLDEPCDEEAAADPITATAWANARALAPVRPGEHLAVGRTWVREPYRDMPVMNLLFWRAVGQCLRADGLAWSFMAMRDDDPARHHLRHYDMYEAGTHARQDGTEYILYAHDWRAVPAQAWLDRLLTGAHDVSTSQEPELAVLSQAEFTDAIRKALRALSRPAELAANPLTRSRLVAGGADPVHALRELLEHAIQDLSEDARSAKFHRALDVTYLRGAPTQEAAAERLSLPFTTYRRHLFAGIDRITEDLWHRELYGSHES